MRTTEVEKSAAQTTFIWNANTTRQTSRSTESARNWGLEIPEAERPEAYLVYPEPWRYLYSTIGRVCREASNDQASVKTYRGDTKVEYNAICTQSLIAYSELRLWWLTCTLCLHREVSMVVEAARAMLFAEWFFSLSWLFCSSGHQAMLTMMTDLLIFSVSPFTSQKCPNKIHTEISLRGRRPSLLFGS